MMTPDPFGTTFYVVHYEALLQGRQGHGKRKALASIVAMAHGEDGPPNAVAGPFLTRQEAEYVQQVNRSAFSRSLNT